MGTTEESPKSLSSGGVIRMESVPPFSHLLEGNNNGTHARSLLWGVRGGSTETVEQWCKQGAQQMPAVMTRSLETVGAGCVNSPRERASLEEERVLNVVQK